MNKQDLIDKIASEHQMTKTEAGEILSTITDTIIDEVKNNRRVVLVGFGTFCQYQRQPRNARNPLTHEIIKVPGSARPKFIAGTAFKKVVDPKFEERCKKARKTKK